MLMLNVCLPLFIFIRMRLAHWAVGRTAVDPTIWMDGMMSSVWQQLRCPGSHCTSSQLSAPSMGSIDSIETTAVLDADTLECSGFS
uniref:Putative secreted peptide n=1 Tax=Anopheles braziliensis TaxID=58242 RepID=A0A2M3ZWB9_9DIPT